MERTQSPATTAFGSRAGLGLLVPLGIIGAVLMTVATTDHGEDRVHAAASMFPDADRDGLRDEFERVIRTDLDDKDTDNDGWSDAEEFALQSNPSDPGRVPDDLMRVSVAMTARQTAGTVHVLSAIYFKDGDYLPDSTFSLGVLIERRMIVLSQQYLIEHGETHSIDARPAGASILFFETSFPESLVLDNRHVVLFAMLGISATDNDPIAAASLDLYGTSDGVILMDYPTDLLPHPTTPNAPVQAGTVYLPISQSGGSQPAVPATWTSARLCVTTSQTVGATGAFLTQEVVSAECVDGYEGFCPPTCPASVGTTFHTVDPLVLAGSQ